MIEGIDERIFSLVSEAFRTKELYYFLHQHAARVEDPENSSVRGHTKLEVGTSEPLIRKLETSLERRRFCGLQFDGFYCPVAVTSDANSVGGLVANASVSRGLTFANDDDYSLIPKDETKIETFVSDGFACTEQVLAFHAASWHLTFVSRIALMPWQQLTSRVKILYL